MGHVAAKPRQGALRAKIPKILVLLVLLILRLKMTQMGLSGADFIRGGLEAMGDFFR
jgi:hypothetical protein